FGENQIKRMVRILRSTVMVRVGGGWEALDEFLVKHDPCRAKGKTNLELRDKYILPAGALDKMAAFDKVRKSPRTPPAHSSASPSTSSVGTPRYASTPGPITKVREKTERSIPMFQRAMMRNGGGASAGTSSSMLSPADSEVSSITSRRS
uniref:GAR domain-containing protein n=1 Tax=Plectus sambesii TaxID=2011161 RepID=A0A914VCI4_9BILA